MVRYLIIILLVGQGKAIAFPSRDNTACLRLLQRLESAHQGIKFERADDFSIFGNQSASESRYMDIFRLFRLLTITQREKIVWVIERMRDRIISLEKLGPVSNFGPTDPVWIEFDEREYRNGISFFEEMRSWWDDLLRQIRVVDTDGVPLNRNDFLPNYSTMLALYNFPPAENVLRNIFGEHLYAIRPFFEGLSQFEGRWTENLKSLRYRILSSRSILLQFLNAAIERHEEHGSSILNFIVFGTHDYPVRHVTANRLKDFAATMAVQPQETFLASGSAISREVIFLAITHPDSTFVLHETDAHCANLARQSMSDLELANIKFLNDTQLLQMQKNKKGWSAIRVVYQSEDQNSTVSPLGGFHREARLLGYPRQ